MDSKKTEQIHKDVLDGKLRKWEVEVDEGTPPVKGEGYFGNLTIIQVGGKKTLVFCDPRDAKCVPMLADWYDDVAMTNPGWDVDTRFQSNPNSNPLLVKKDGKWTMIGCYGEKVKRGDRYLRVPYRDDWYDSIARRDGVVNGVRCYEAKKDGQTVYLTPKCQVVEEDVKAVMEEVKTWDKDRVVRDWIEKGRPCYGIHGFRFRGASARPITTEKARELIKKHSFGKGFSSLGWSVEDGRVALVFESYSESDML